MTNDSEEKTKNKPAKRRRGRPPGSLNRSTLERRALLATEGMGPLEYLEHLVATPAYPAYLRAKAATTLTRFIPTPAATEPVPAVEPARKWKPPPPPKEPEPPPGPPLTDKEVAKLHELQRWDREVSYGLEPYDSKMGLALESLMRRARPDQLWHETAEERADRHRRAKKFHGY